MQGINTCLADIRQQITDVSAHMENEKFAVLMTDPGILP